MQDHHSHHSLAHTQPFWDLLIDDLNKQLTAKDRTIIKPYFKEGIQRHAIGFPLLFWPDSLSENSSQNEWLITGLKISFYGWLHYTLLDDGIDDQIKSKHHWILTDKFHHLLLDNINSFQKQYPDFHYYCQMLIATMDYWNRALSTTVDTTALKSVGLQITPLLFNCISTDHQPSFRTDWTHHPITNFITHLTIARQFNDDLHDWKEDFQNDKDTPVTLLLKKHLSAAVALNNNTDQLADKVFTEKCFESLCLEALEYCHLAIKDLDYLPSYCQISSLRQLVERSQKPLVNGLDTYHKLLL